ncbi:MAG: TetR/AcrR family transcriptional regulator [Pseudomonadales bacterium]|nr:TetR/AcrR family transcriptional regulator [Pseudomonadales bacterium]
MSTVDLINLLQEARNTSFDETQKRILDAALEEAAAQGLHGLTIEGVARRSRLNRATIYRQVGNRDQLQTALAMREAKHLIDKLSTAVAGISDPETLLVEGFVAAIRFAREHPVIARTVKYEPGTLITIALANDAALLRTGATFMADTIRWAQENGQAKHLDADTAGDVAARLFSSFVLLPGGHNNLHDDDATRQFATTTLVPMLLGKNGR